MDSDKDNHPPPPQTPSQENDPAGAKKEEDPPPENAAQSSSPLPPDLAKITKEIDQCLSSLLDWEDVPLVIEQFLVLVEERMDGFDSGDRHVKWSLLKEEEAAWFVEAVERMSSLWKWLAKFASEYKYAYSINRVGSVVQRAMAYLEEEFKVLLEEYKIQSEGGLGLGYSDETTSELMRVSRAMLEGGYEAECCQVYLGVRRDALEDQIVQLLGLQKHSIDDVHKKSWESLEREIELWILKFTNFATAQFPSERQLSRCVFAGHPCIAETLFRWLSCSITKHFLKFAEAIALTRRSSDKLFKFLALYDAIREVISGIGALLPQGVAVELKHEALMIRSHLGEAMISILNDLENSISNDHGKNPVPGGAVHPLTTYIINYLEFTAIYTETLQQVYLQHQRIASSEALASPFQAQILKIMELLESNIEAKSKYYKDPSLSSIFMMNNGRYMLKKIKKSNGLHSLLAETWYRKMSSDLRQYHKGYQRETWGKLLGCLNPDGLTGSNKQVKPLLKERFKNFNAMFDEIRKTQTGWVISDEQLQSELRVSISNMVVPAYRSFLSRYSQIFSPGRQTEKYIKHQPDDVETTIECLFSGTPATSGKRKL